MQSFNKKQNSPSCFLFLLFCVILLVSYSNSFEASWQLDDKPNILSNSRIQLSELSSSQFWQASHAKPGSGGFYRPVACISLALNWYFGQDNVLGYHIVNLLIHCCTAWFLFLTIKTLFSTPRFLGSYSSSHIVFISVSATLFWALNPIHTQAVTYIVQRMTSMAAMFALLAILFYLKARVSGDIAKRTFFLICAAGSYLMALLSKENAIIIILTIPVFELVFFQTTLSRHALKKVGGGIMAGLFISVLAALALHPELFDFIFNYYSNRPFTLGERLLTEQRIVLHYLSQLFFPAPGRLSIEHDVVLSISAIAPWTTFAAILTNGLLVLLAIRVVRSQPFLSLAILFYYICHLVESTILPLELVFEHRNYLPSFFLFVPVALLFHWFIIRLQQYKFATVAIIGVVTLIFASEGYATYERNKAWQTEVSLWLDAAKKAPNSARPLSYLALKLAQGPNPSEVKYRKAIELTERSLSMQVSQSERVAFQLGNMASYHNNLGEYHQGIAYYEKALALAPDAAGLRYNMCKTLIMTGNFPQAKDELTIILDQGFVHADYFNMLGFINLWLGQPEQALPAIQQAMHYAPGRPDILLTLSKCFALLGDYNKANFYLSLTRKKGRDDATVSLCIIENALRGGNIKQAQDELQRSLQRFPLAYLLQPLSYQPAERYREVPLDSEIITPFIRAELPTISQTFLP